MRAGRWPRRCAGSAVPPAVIQVNNRKLPRASSCGVGRDGPRRRRCGWSTSWTRSGRPGWPRLLVAEAGCERRRRPRRCLAFASIRAEDTSFVDAGAGARGRATRCSTQGLEELAAVVEAAARARRPALVVADLRIARGLDYYTGTVYETPAGGLRVDRLDLLGRPVRRAGQRRAATTYPGVGISLGRHPAAVGVLLGRGLVTASPLGAHGRARGRGRRGRRAEPRTPSPGALRARGIPTEVAPRRRQVRQADPLRRPPRHPVRLVPGRRRGEARGQGHPLRRAGAGRPRARGRRRPRTCTRAFVRTHHDDEESNTVIRTHEAGTLRAGARRADRHPGRVGRPAPRPRRSGVPRPARRLRHRPGRRARRGGGPPAAQRVLPAGHRRGRGPARGQREPGAGHRRRRGAWSTSLEVLSESAPAAVPDRRARRGRRGGPAALPLPRPAPARRPRGRMRLRSKVNQIARDVLLDRDFVEIETPTLTRSTPGGRPRLPGPGPAAAGQLVRAAAVPAAVQAAADGRRHGALLPDRPLLPRRGLPRRPPAGVHPARHRDELRRAGRRHRGRRGRRPGAVDRACSATRSARSRR